MLFEYLLAISILLSGTLIIFLLYVIPEWDEKGTPGTLIKTLTAIWVLSLLACVGVLAFTGLPLGPIPLGPIV